MEAVKAGYTPDPLTPAYNMWQTEGNIWQNMRQLWNTLYHKLRVSCIETLLLSQLYFWIKDLHDINTECEFYQLVVLRASHSSSLSPLSVSPIVCWRGCHIVTGLSVPILSVTYLIVTGLSVHLCPFVSMCVHFCPTYFGDVIPHNVVTGRRLSGPVLSASQPMPVCLSVCLCC